MKENRLNSETFDRKDLEMPIPVHPSKTTRPLPEGHSVWCYGGAEYTVEHVKQYNQKASENQKIRYLFPYAGSITFTRDGGYEFAWEPKTALAHSDHLAKSDLGEEVRVIPMIDGLSAYSDQLTSQDWDRLASEIGSYIHPEKKFYGVQFDIEPHDDVICNLFSMLRNYTDKPITAAVAHPNRETFLYTDVVVYMGYDWAEDLRSFRERALKDIPLFLQHADETNGKALVGVPAIATHREYESISADPNSPRDKTGFTMDQFVEAAMDGIKRGAARNKDGYLGISIWALHEQDGLHTDRDVSWYYPTEISDKIWEKFREPIGDV
ncbi:MAG: hypothetical protein GKR87_15160 [Kiritimatiellae bacterium]|nr:hypothetical protein [Kiritimatiellia bacterium]